MAFLRKPFSPAHAIILSRSMATSHWAGVPMGPPDPILGLNEAFAKDTDKRKVNLGVGAYRDNNGQPLVLSSVRKAEEAVVSAKMNKEYAGIAGVAGFVNHSMKFAYGDSPQLKDGLVVGMQALSGTGSCRMALDFFARFKGKDAVVWVPDPTWPNHNNMIKDAGMQVKTYRYYDPATRGLAFGPFMDDLTAMPTVKSFFSTLALTIPPVWTQAPSSGVKSQICVPRRITTLSWTPLIKALPQATLMLTVSASERCSRRA